MANAYTGTAGITATVANTWDSNTALSGATAWQGFNVADLLSVVGQSSDQANARLVAMTKSTDQISISDMFDMQMLMNHLGQMTEMSGSVLSALNTSVLSLARNIKG